jgi:hypothetical protein
MLKKAALPAAATLVLATSAHASTVQTVFVIALENHNVAQPNAKFASALRQTIARHP